MIKIGIVGTGSIGKNHVRVCSELKNVEIIGVADSNLTTVKDIAERYKTKVFSNYKD